MPDPMFNEDGSLTAEMEYWLESVESVRGRGTPPHSSVDEWIDWYLSA